MWDLVDIHKTGDHSTNELYGIHPILSIMLVNLYLA